MYTRLTNGSNTYLKDTLFGAILAPSKPTFILPLTERRKRWEHCVVSHKISDDDLAKKIWEKTINSQIKETRDTRHGTSPINTMIKTEIYAYFKFLK